MRAAGTLPGNSSSWHQHYRPGDINDVVEAAVNLQIISWHQEIIQVGKFLYVGISAKEYGSPCSDQNSRNILCMRLQQLNLALEDSDMRKGVRKGVRGRIIL